MKLFLTTFFLFISTNIFAEKFTFKQNVLMKANGIEHRLGTINDSRCKQVCVWAGRIYVDLKINDKKHNFAYYPGMHFEIKEIEGYSYKIEDVDIEARKATFEIEKIEEKEKEKEKPKKK